MNSKHRPAVFLLFALSIVFLMSWKGKDYTILNPISDTNVHWGSVQSEIERITKSDPNSPIGNKIEKFGMIDGNDIRYLFPNWKFYGFEYSNYIKNVSDKKEVHLALGLRHTLAIFSDSNTVKTYRFFNINDYDGFLKTNKISIRDVNDAKLVWGAWCEIYRGGRKDLKIEKVSDNEWKLGIYDYYQTVSEVNGVKTIVKRTHFSKVTTDPNTKQITEWKSLVETSNKSL